MALTKIPLTTDPNQTFTVTVPINNINKTLSINLSYLDNVGYWVMDITDVKTNTVVASAIPLLTGSNILGQLQHLNIGSIVIAKVSDIPNVDADNTNLGTDFVVLWGDNVG